MNITFLIGNGFDINLNLNTRYSNFYEYYRRNCPKDLLSGSIIEDFELWSDLELGLGAFLENVNEEQIDEYLNCKSTLERLLSEYLSLESNRIAILDEKALAEEFQEKVIQFYSDFCAIDVEHYENLIGKHQGTLNYSFVSFNYTNVLDTIVKVTKNMCKPFSERRLSSVGYHDIISMPHHIHGKLTEDLILGLDNSDQIRNENLKTNPELTNYIIKSSVNNALGEKKIFKMEEIINNSSYVCLFGLSIGETDRMWWAYIIQWLKKNTKNRLVLFTRDNKLTNLSAQEKIRFRDSKRKDFLSRGGCNDFKAVELIQNQIIIIPNSEIFNLDNIQIEDRVNN